MPKMKTNRSAAKRFRVTGSGKIVHRKAWGGHYFTKKSNTHRGRLKGNKAVGPANSGQVRRLLGV